MSSKLLIGFCCLVAAMLAGSVVLAERLSPDETEHLAFSHLLEERRSLDQDVVRHALEARFQFAANYDQLAKDELDARSLQAAGLPGFLRAAERQQIQQALSRYLGLAHEREGLLEHFKTRNALLKNSVSYFPSLTGGVVSQTRDPVLLQAVAELSNKTLSLALRSDPILFDGQRRARDELAELARARVSGPPSRSLGLMLAHAATIAEEKAQTDATLKQILTLPLAPRRYDVSVAYQRAYARGEGQAHLLGQLVSTLAVGLLALLGYLGLRLRSATKALSRSHERLERAVAARTSELRDEMLRREHIEIELRQAQKLEAVGQLAAGIAHEINTPIQYVGDSLYFLREAFADVLRLLSGYRDALAGDAVLERHQLVKAAGRIEADVDFSGLKAEIPAAFERALDGTRQVTHIVQAMKKFSHASPDKAPLDVNEAIGNTLTVAHNEYSSVADLVTQLGVLPEVVCNAAGIRQLLLNLIVNAAHAIGDVLEQTGVRGRITIRTELRDESVIISIADTGTGIPEAVRERVFDPFFTTKPPGKGSGQGLAISQSIVDQHGGKLWFDTSIGEGTIFFVQLPVQAQERRTVPNSVEAA